MGRLHVGRTVKLHARRVLGAAAVIGGVAGLCVVAALGPTRSGSGIPGYQKQENPFLHTPASKPDSRAGAVRNRQPPAPSLSLAPSPGLSAGDLLVPVRNRQSPAPSLSLAPSPGLGAGDLLVPVRTTPAPSTGSLSPSPTVRTTDEIDYTNLSDLAPFLYDYGQLAHYADQLVLMAIDFHWSAGDPGPIVTLSDLKNVLSDVQSYHISGSRLAVESAVYGYDWTLNRAGHLLAGTQAATVTATDLAGRGWVKAGSKDGETYYEYTAAGHRHAVWFAGTGLNYQAAQLRRLCPGCAVTAWATGNPDPAGSALILQALGG